MLRLGIFPSPSSKDISLASQHIILDTIEFSSEISFKTIILGKRNTIFESLKYYFKMVRWWLKADAMITIYPYICINLRRNYLFRKLESILIRSLNQDTHSILYIVDLPIEQAEINEIQQNDVYKKACEIEACIFRSFDVLLVFNENMKKKIQEKYGLDDDVFVLFEMLDYKADFPHSEEKGIHKPIKIAFLASNLNGGRFKWIKKLPYSSDVIYSFFGNNGEWINELSRNDFKYKGIISPKEVPNILSKQYHFGMINYDVPTEKYLEYGSTSKFSAYVAAGLPLLCSKKLSYISFLIQKYRIGLCFESLDNIPNLIAQLSGEEYDLMRKNCLILSEKVRRGHFFKSAVNQALHKLSSART